MSLHILELLCSIAILLSAQAGAVSFHPRDLRVELLRDPAAVNTSTPRLSWILEPASQSARGLYQSAYQILVASDADVLGHNQGDLWDSGRIQSDQTTCVVYKGRPLAPGQQCFWKVRAWDQNGRTSNWSAPGFWRVGLLDPSDWKGKWIGREEHEQVQLFTGAPWIWFPEGRPEQGAPLGTRYFRYSFDLLPGQTIRSAEWLMTGDNEFEVFVNGVSVGSGANFKAVNSIEVGRWLVMGKNVLAASVKNGGDGPNPAGFVGRLTIRFNEGSPLVVETGSSWRSSGEASGSWMAPGYDDSTWLAARVLGPAGMQPWGDIGAPEDRRLSARWLRKEFQVSGKARSAVVYMSGLGLSELYLNGKRVGDAVLSPGLTEYDKRAFYVSYDVTDQMQRGDNVVGVVLGNGRFWAPRGKVPTGTRTFGAPRLRFEMRISYADGTSDLIVSDPTWKLTTDGPIRANCEYDGEEYDARLELTGWNLPGYDDCKWQQASELSGPGGLIVAENIDPIRVVQTIQPIALSQPRPGVYIFDMGQNMVGWCRLKVSGPRNTQVRLRHAETLKPDGMLYLDNIRGAKVTETYTLKGERREVYEPRFTYHGFRFVELTGFPGEPSLSSIEGCVVHDDLDRAGTFSSSNPLLERLHSNIFWGVRGNYRSIPTDCPQRDERQGWLGDRSAESKGETYLFNIAALYSKWLQDMADAQKDSGSLPDVCPSYWPIYSDNVTWPSSTVIIPWSMLQQYGDTGLISHHYSSARLWIDYMWGFATNGLISRDSYGDWCVPPEDPKLIHSNDPGRKTDRTLLATSYFYHDLRLMGGYADLLGKKEDALRFADLAAQVKRAFNRKFFKPEQGLYDNGSQTSCVLPLAFDLVPQDQRQRVFAHLVQKISLESSNHIGTGLVGGQWLMRVLSDNGRPDLAYTIATQRDYPSWGYMISKGATTVWELWNGDTADPAMNSGNHVMLVGDLGIWMYEYLAGIRPDSEQPGFKHMILRPEPVGNLKSVSATHESPHGLIRSEWEKDGKTFLWRVTVPVNTTATIYVPASSASLVTESGRPALRSRNLTFLRWENDRAVFRAGSGVYRFQSRQEPDLGSQRSQSTR